MFKREGMYFVHGAANKNIMKENNMKTIIPLIACLLSGCIFSSDKPKTVTPNYGTKLALVTGIGNEVYYKTPVTEAEAGSIYLYLRGDLGLFDPANGGTALQVTKHYSTFQLRFIPRENVVIDDDVIAAFRLINGFVSQNALGGQPVEIHLCNNQFETIQIITGG